MREYVSLSIWCEGPGRSFDNGYILTGVTYEKDILHIFFDDNEECLIFKPSKLRFFTNKLVIERAEKIIWKYYHYGKPKKIDYLNIIEYSMIDNLRVKISSTGEFRQEKVIEVNGKIAFEIHGDSNVLQCIQF